MSEFEHNYQPPEGSKRPTAEQVKEIIINGKDFSGLDISDLKLNGFDMKGCKFIDCDARDIDLSPGFAKNTKDNGVEISTDIRETDWTNATFASAGESTSFRGVNAKGSTFGYQMTLAERQQMILEITKKEGRGPNDFECGGYFNFEGVDADFSETKWNNIDFGGGSGYEAFFTGANFTKAEFKGCNMRDIDLSDTQLEGVKFTINEPGDLFGMTINSAQVDKVIQGIIINNPEKQKQFETIKTTLKTSRDVLKIYFRLEIVD